MWIVLAILSALCLGVYDISKKRALACFSVVTVLTYSLLASAIILSFPLLYSWIGVRHLGLPCPELLYVPSVDIHAHGMILLKSCIVLSSWIFAYISVKHLPLSVASPMQATRPMWTLLGAVTLLSEHLVRWQWVGILLALTGTTIFALSSLRGRSEEVVYIRLRYLLALMLSILIGACSGLYDKYIMRSLDHNAVQVYYIIYQAIIMLGIYFLMQWRKIYLRRRSGLDFMSAIFPAHSWKNPAARAVLSIAIFLILSDFVYFLALSNPDAMIAVVSTIRRGGTVIPFLYGVFFLREKHTPAKVLGLFLILLGLICLCLASV